jgi:3-mercaptopyruvate sulfurtransferase SseA
VRLAADRPLFLLADEPALARAAALDLREAGAREIALVGGGFAAWQAAGLGVEASPGLPADADCIDYLFFTHERHAGNAAAARQYLAWETNLVNQLDAQERASFAIAHD